MTGPDTVRGWIVVRRQRTGSLFDNAAGDFDSIGVEQTREEAERWQQTMTTPRDWDVVEVEIRILRASPDHAEAEPTRQTEADRVAAILSPLPPSRRPGCTCVIGPTSVVPSQSCPVHGHGPIPGRK